MTWVVTAIVASTVVSSAYGAKKAKDRQQKATEQQNVRDLITGSAPNISNVQEVVIDELQGSDPGALEEALAAMNYQEQGEVPIPGEAGVPSAAGDMSQMTQEEALQLLQEQGGIMMARGGPVGTTEDTYYFDVGNIMNMMTDSNPQIQNVGMQLADQMTANPGMSMIPATRDQIQGMAYGGSVGPKKYDDGGQPKGTDQSLSELKQIAKSRGISRIEELLGFRLPEGFGEQDIEDVLLNAGLGELGIPITKRGDNYSYARELGEDSNINVSVNPDQKAVQLGFEKRFNTGGPVQPRRYQDGSEGGITPQGTLTTSGYASNTPSLTEYEDPSEVDPQIREYLELQNSLSGLGTELLNTITTADTPIEQSINTIRGLFNSYNEDPDLRGTIFSTTEADRQRMLDREGLSQEERRDLYFQDMEDAEAKQGREENLRAFIEMQRDKRRATGGPVQPSRYDGGGVVDDPDPMKEVLKDLLINQIPGVSQLRALKETGKDVKEAEGLEKVVELLDLAPINPVKLGRGMKERVSARRAARRAAEEEAESRVFGPR